MQKSKALNKARIDFKETDKKARKSVFNYNHSGIAKYGVVFRHLNSAAKRAIVLGYLENNQELSAEMKEWAERHGVIAETTPVIPE